MSEQSGTTQRRLTRSTSNKVVAGVAGGLADYTGLDPVIFRIGFIALAVAGGAGLLMYLLAWLAIPQEGEASSPGAGIVARAREGRWIPLALIAIAVVILLSTFDGGWGGPVLWAVALIAVGIVLLQDEPEDAAPRERTPARTEAMPASSAAVDGGASSAAPAVAASPRVRRRRSPLGAYTLGAALLAVAAAVALAAADVVDLDMGQYLGLVLLVLGTGLVAGAWWGRARLLVLGGLVLIPCAIVASAISVPLEGTVGDQWVAPRTQLDDGYQLMVGSFMLDLSRYRFGPEPTEVDIDFVLGDVDVLVPPGVDVTTNLTMDGGKADVFGDPYTGSDIAAFTTSQKPGLTEGELILNVRGGLGGFDASWATWIDAEKRRALERLEDKQAELEAAKQEAIERAKERKGEQE
jgi:phage shock protein PspC (stress-responsive transcriptional regulator)